jgi:putative transposase
MLTGVRRLLGLREGATENAAVVSELLGDLAARGLDFSVPRLYVLDGGKALPAAGRHLIDETRIIFARRQGK